MCMPGDNVEMTIELIHPIAMDQGLTFAIREGGRTVGSVSYTHLHRANILSKDFEKLGVGYVKTGGTYKHYWVQLFSA